MLKVLVILLLLFTNYAVAHQYFVVDIEKVIYTSEVSKNLKTQIDSIKNKYQKEIEQKESELRKNEEQLKKEQKNLSNEAFEKKVKDFQTKVIEIQRNIQTKRANLEESYQEALAKINEATSQIINDLAKEKKADIVFPTSQLMYADPKFDETLEVLKRLNSKMTKIDLKKIN